MTCPICRWETPTSNYRVRRDGKLYIYTANERPSEKSYPKILDIEKYNNKTMYREVHKCKNCLLEFEQTIIEEAK